MDHSSFQKVTGIIQNISSGSSCCMRIISLMTDDQETVDFVISPDTIVIDCVRLRKGMRVAAFYDRNLPAPAIYPPRYQAELVTAVRRDQNVMLSYFDDDLVSEDNTLKLNLTPFTNIVTQNGQRFLCSPENEELLVYYTMSTKSIPAQTTPQKIVVICPSA